MPVLPCCRTGEYPADAVLMIAVKLGIRTSDIRNLRPANFNWEQHLVSFTQVKTGEPITLPLPTDVGWAVIDYLKNGRPVSDAPEIFSPRSRSIRLSAKL